jgi:hypothetical protein
MNMLEQMAIFAAESVAALFLTMVTGIAVVGIFWARSGAYRR